MGKYVFGGDYFVVLGPKDQVEAAKSLLTGHFTSCSTNPACGLDGHEAGFDGFLKRTGVSRAQALRDGFDDLHVQIGV